MKRSIAILSLLLAVLACKKEKPETSTDPDEPSGEGLVEAVTLDLDNKLLFPEATTFIMQPEETTVLKVKHLSEEGNATAAADITFKSSNEKVAKVTADGTVAAVGEGVCQIMAEDKQGNKTTASISVSSQEIAPLAAPVNAAFQSPVILLSIDEGGVVPVSVLNRLGEAVGEEDIELIFSKGGTETRVKGKNIAAGFEEGAYRVTVVSKSDSLHGEANVIAYKTKSSSIFADSISRIVAINYSWGRYPRYFTKPGITSKPIRGLVFRTIPTKVNGRYIINVVTKLEDIPIKTDNASVLSASGTTLTAVKAGLGRWRAEFDNYIGSWYSSQVFYDFEGGWYCEDDKMGHEIRMVVPPISEAVFCEGSEAFPMRLDTLYKSNSWSLDLAHLKMGEAIFVDLVTEAYSLAEVEIGPSRDCLICGTPSRNLRKGWGFGGISFVDHLRYGSLIYLDDDEFEVSDNYKHRFKFIRKNVTTEPPAPQISMSATSGRRGDVITIKGPDFGTATSVLFGNKPASSIRRIDNNTIEVVVGLGRTGSVSVELADEQRYLIAEFTFLKEDCDQTAQQEVTEGNSLDLVNYWRSDREERDFTVKSYRKSALDPRDECHYVMSGQLILPGGNRPEFTIVFSHKPSKDEVFKVVESGWLLLGENEAYIDYESYDSRDANEEIKVSVSGGSITATGEGIVLNWNSISSSVEPMTVSFVLKGK